MKKILIVLMVLGLANIASAAVSLDYVDDGAGHVDVVFNQDAEYVDGAGGELYIDFTGGTVTGLDVTDLTPIPVLDMAVGEIGWDWGLNSLEIYSGQVHVSKIATLGIGTPGADSNMQQGDPAFIIMMGWPDPVDYEGTFGFSFDYEGEVTVDFNSAELNEWDGGSLNTEGLGFTVPEPMTMTLLGLGGLALLRRRR